MKYIGADRLRAEIERRRLSNRYIDTEGYENELLALIDELQQEQSEMDLEKFTEKIKSFQGRYKHPESIAINGAMAFMARMFYQYPNVARQWYDNLPKATMD